MIRKQTIVALICAIALSACTSMRVTGFVTDEVTGDPIGSCGITIGERYVHVDSAGHYSVNARTSWKTMKLIAPGYHPKSVTIDTSKTRYPTINVQLTPKKAGRGSDPEEEATP